MLDPTTLNPGCVVDGHWGNYALSRMLTIADDILGTTFYAEAVTQWRETEDPYDGSTPLPDATWDGFTFEFLGEIADEAESALNDQTPAPYVWHWHDGEFFLSVSCEDDDCTDSDHLHYD